MSSNVTGFFHSFDRRYSSRLSGKLVALRNITTFFGDKVGATDTVLKTHYNTVVARSTEEAKRAITESRTENCITIVSVNKTTLEEFDKIVKHLVNKKTQRFEGAERYLASAGYMTAVASDEETKYTTILIADTNPIYLSDKIYVEIGVILPSCMPWLYKGAPPKEFLELATLISTKKYDEAYALLDDNHEIQAAKEALASLETALCNRYKKRLEQTDVELSRYRDHIRSYETSILDCYQKMEKLSLEREGMLASGIDKKVFAEVTDYMRKADMSLIGMNHNQVYLRVNGYFTNYDGEVAKKYVNNVGGVIYEPFSASLRKTVREIFIDTFLNCKYKIKAYAEISVSLSDGRPQRYDSGSKWIRNGRLHNPHILGFDCFGSTSTVTMEAAHTANFMGLFMQLKAQTQNLNFSDSAVMPLFSRQIRGNADQKLFESTETGELYSFNDLLEMYKKEE